MLHSTAFSPMLGLYVAPISPACSHHGTGTSSSDTDQTYHLLRIFPPQSLTLTDLEHKQKQVPFHAGLGRRVKCTKNLELFNEI